MTDLDPTIHPIRKRLSPARKFKHHSEGKSGFADTTIYIDRLTRATIAVTEYHDGVTVTAFLTHGNDLIQTKSEATREAVDGIKADVVGMQITDALQELERYMAWDKRVTL